MKTICQKRNLPDVLGIVIGSYIEAQEVTILGAMEALRQVSQVIANAVEVADAVREKEELERSGTNQTSYSAH